jgi:hypothetical protein
MTKGESVRETVAVELAEGRNPLRPTADGPLATASHGILNIDWGSPSHISVVFDLFTTERRTGETSAEVKIYSAADNKTLHITRLNLLSTVAHERLAKYLEPRTAHLNADWPDMISYACQVALEWHRTGEPAILLRDAPEPIFGSKLIPPILTADGPTILFGDGGSGKSLIALALGLSLHTGRVLIDGLEPEAEVRVGFLDWEWEGHVHKRRMARLWPTSDLPDLVYVKCDLPLRSEENRLRRIIKEHGLGFLIVDSVALAAGGAPEEAEVAVQFFNTLRLLGLPTLCVAHVTKSEAKAAADKPFGSAFWANSARSLWYAHRGDGSNRHQLVVGLFNRKNSDEHLEDAFSLTIAFGDNRTEITKHDIRAEADLSSNRPLKERIIDELRGGPRTIADLSDELDANIDTVRMALKRGKGKVFVLTTTDRVEHWALLTHEVDG